MARVIDLGQPVNRSSPLNRGLVSWWMALPYPPYWGGPRFLDLCGRNHGTLNTGPAWSGNIGRAGGFGAIRFPGSATLGARVNCGNVLIGGLTSVTFAYSAYALSSGSSGDFGTVFSKNVNNPVLITALNSNGVAFTLNGGAADIRDSTNNIAPLNKWNRIVCRWVSGETGGMKIYVNGVERVSGTYTGTLTTNSSNFVLGCREDNADRVFDGWLDDLKVVAGYGWSQSDVLQDYYESLRGHPTTLNYYSPRFYFDIGGGGGTAVPVLDQGMLTGGLETLGGGLV